MTQEEVNSLLPSLQVHPFPKIYDFTISGSTLSTEENNDIFHRRAAYLICPKCQAKDNIYDLTDKTPFSFIQCEGNQPPEKEVTNMFGTRTQTVRCAGIVPPHFHVYCRCCDFQFFLSMPHVKGAAWEE